MNKKCISCGREIPEEAHFCPYCMTKQNEESIKVIQRKKGRKIAIIIICVVIFLALGVAGAIIGKRYYDKKYVLTDNYGAYLGSWDYSEDDEYDADEDDTEKLRNSYSMQIVSAKGDEVVACFSKTDETLEPAKTFNLDYQKIKMKDGMGEFEWEVDNDIDMMEGTHETGKGTLILKNGKAIAILKGDRNTSRENYNIDMHIAFERDEKMYPGYTVELEYNTGWFLNMKESYPVLEKKELKHDRWIYHYSNDGIVLKGKENSYYNFPEVIVDFRKLDTLYNYEYRGLGKDSTKEDFKKLFYDTNKEEELWTEESSYIWDVEDDENNMYLVVQFDKNDKIVKMHIYDLIAQDTND